MSTGLSVPSVWPQAALAADGLAFAAKGFELPADQPVEFVGDHSGSLTAVLEWSHGTH
ncbi:hypothetical protein [Mycobacterium sp. MS1601]|uniref:hypothetical protein n=1 Tax=Mycobacterium sp. MS1601 TaxID=1936029 RepID=UPI0012FA4E57|nr:hypothetical protein [Mycobacterium sp. MS1601]